MREPITIAYLEDDPAQSSTVERWLDNQSMHCHVYRTTDALRIALQTTSYDAIMLDVEINGESAGLDMLEYLCNVGGNDAPVLMVSSKSYWQEALSGGANDFLEKPLTSRKLLTHLHRLLRPVAQEATIEHYPPYQLNTTAQKFTLEGDPLDLSDDEYELASTLFRYFGKVLSHKQLMEKLPANDLNRSNRKIESDMLELKRKMDLRDIDGWRLESVYQHGYRLVNTKYDASLQ